MRIMLVRQIVRVDDLRLGRADDGLEFLDKVRMAGILDCGTAVVEQVAGAIFGNGSRLLLLLRPHQAHLLVAVVRIEVVPRTARAIGHSHAGEPLIGLAKAAQDSVHRADGDIILMGHDGHFSRPRNCGLGLHAIGDEQLRVRVLQLHH